MWRPIFVVWPYLHDEYVQALDCLEVVGHGLYWHLHWCQLTVVLCLVTALADDIRLVRLASRCCCCCLPGLCFIEGALLYHLHWHKASRFWDPCLHFNPTARACVFVHLGSLSRPGCVAMAVPLRPASALLLRLLRLLCQCAKLCNQPVNAVTAACLWLLLMLFPERSSRCS